MNIGVPELLIILCICTLPIIAGLGIFLIVRLANRPKKPAEEKNQDSG